MKNIAQHFVLMLLPINGWIYMIIMFNLWILFIIFADTAATSWPSLSILHDSTTNAQLFWRKRKTDYVCYLRYSPCHSAFKYNSYELQRDKYG